MSVSLLDVNVLVALFDPSHVHHDPAHQWFSRNRRKGWATCPLTENGCARVLSHPAYPGSRASTAEIVSLLRTFCASGHHEFWPDSVTLGDQTLFRPAAALSHNHLTDIYLLGLAVAKHGKLVTFDRGISIKTIIGSAPSNLDVIDSA
jgi:toxin-antitoxin system PIN domain toxin